MCGVDEREPNRGVSLSLSLSGPIAVINKEASVALLSAEERIDKIIILLEWMILDDGFYELPGRHDRILNELIEDRTTRHKIKVEEAKKEAKNTTDNATLEARNLQEINAVIEELSKW